MASEDGGTVFAGARVVVVFRTAGGFLAAFVDAVFVAAGFLAGRLLRRAFFAAPFFVVRRGAGGASSLDHRSIHSSSTRHVLLRAARPVSMPRWPPGTISKRTSRDPLSSGSTGRTAATGAMPSVAPPKTSTGAVIADSSMVRSPSSMAPAASELPLTKRW